MDLPTRLERPPLIEAVFEMRFAPLPNVAVELLPGLLYPSLQHLYPSIDQAPAGSIPRELLRRHPNLRYSIQYKLRRENEAVVFGENVFGVTCAGSYPGWATFRDHCAVAVDALKSANYVASVERYSLRYSNFVELPPTGTPVAPFNITVDVGLPLEPDGFRLRFEKRSTPYVTVVELSAVSEATTPQGTRRGALFALDTIRLHDAGAFMENVPDHLDKAHNILESMFFGLLKKPTLDGFGPLWEEK